MPTIQVRDVPEEAYEVLRRRARTSGRSLQAYMRDQVIALASQPTKDEAVARIEAYLARRPPSRSPAPASIVEDVASGRR